ncbi:MAG: SUMF1/EgtB/PvdO family nonheme iron enzyme [Polyangiaceae bacterium]|nr:SUMF1/EgtB/PvdO family nonheme iron enzyme [Polyangiaceae bacterium]
MRLDKLTGKLITSPAVYAAAAVGLLVFAMPNPQGAEAKAKGCPDGMVTIGDKFCIDQYEASVVEIAGKETKKHSPYKGVDGLKVKAVSKKGVVPQAHISKEQAENACKNGGKRLCTDEEWLSACKGKKPTTYPYGDDYKAGRCNDSGVSSFNHYYGQDGGPAPQSAFTWANMNDERLNQLKGTVAPAGQFSKCKNSYKVYDMVGNLHEWTAATTGTFRGGYYLDTKINGEGCNYKTTAHGAKYHDYSTGFRCCK